MKHELSPQDADLLNTYVQSARSERLDDSRRARIEATLVASLATTAAAGALATKGAVAGTKLTGLLASAWLKLGLGVSVLVAAGVTTAYVAREERQIATTTVHTAVRQPLAPTTSSTAWEPVPVPSAAPTASTKAPMPLAETRSELELVRQARAALQSDPDQSLALCTIHAKTYPSGQLAEEREVVAIDALMRVGRASDAKARARQFTRRWPQSAYGPRIETLTGP